MIRESLYFSFAGRKSTEFPIYNVSISDGLFEEPLTSGKAINEVTVRGNPKPYFIEARREPKTFPLRFAFHETWNDEMIDEIVRWLDVDFYEPLFFSSNIDRVFYAMPVDGIQQIHNGLKQGYITLNMRCDSPFSYSHQLVTPWIDSNETIEIPNKGHFPIAPQIWIQKVGDGDLTISNTSVQTEEFTFHNLKDKEEIYIDCENEIIESSLPNVYRYDDFNDKYLILPYGLNTLKVQGNAKLKFEYRYVFS
jgi:phage-related protein